MTSYRSSLGFYLIALLGCAGLASAQDTRTDDGRIYLEAGAFDPLRGSGPASGALRLAAQTATDSWIVQFHAPLTRQQRELLTTEYGLKLTSYIPNLAYLERLPPERLARLRQSELVRAIVAYQPAFKLSPRIGQLRYSAPALRNLPGLLLLAVLFDDVDPQQAAAALAALPGVSAVEVHDLRKEGGPARIQFQLASRAQLPAVAALEGVRWIEQVAERVEDNGTSAGTMQSGTPGTEPVWDRGIHGEGQIVGVVDSGAIDINHCMFRDPVNNTPSATHRKVLQVRPGSVSGHATFVGGIVGGDDFNNLGTGANRGNAWAVRLVSGANSEVMLNALTANRAQGATIHTNSWHDDTAGSGNPATYNQTAADVDTFTWNNQDHLVLGSMGNIGEEQGPPGTAKNAIGVNAARQDPNEMNVGDGNPGPTADGRRKPDIVSPGCTINSATSATACTIGQRGCATSWATPATAAASALIRQYYREGWYPSGTARPSDAVTPTGALLKATLLNATIDMTGPPGYPSNNEGWGLVRLNNTLFFPGAPRRLRAWDVRNAAGLATGEFQAFTIDVAASTQPLRVTLAWSDPPGTAGAANPIVNNLNLTVTAPDATTFRGNVFAGGQSTPGGVPDALNNVEQVLINNPAIGTWTIRVGAQAVNVGAPGQGFAVVATAMSAVPAIQIPGGGVSLAATCLGAGALATLEVCNEGEADLIVTSIASSNPQFSVPAPSAGFPVTVGPNACFPFNVAFAPTAEGPQAATLTVASNDPETPSVAVTASGSGTQKDIRVTGSTAYGVVSAWTPGERTLAVCNIGQCPLAVTGASVGCADFTLVGSPLPATLPAGACLDLTVAFTPLLPGPKSCQLEIASDDPDTPLVTRTLSAKTPPSLSVHAGWVDSHGALANVADDGSSFELDFTNPVWTDLDWQLRLGHSRFDGATGLPDTKVWRLGVNAKYTFNPGAPLQVFVNGGPDLYHFDPGSFEGGVNLGLGLHVPAGSLFSFEATYDYNRALTPSPDLPFSQVMLGMLVSF